MTITLCSKNIAPYYINKTREGQLQIRAEKAMHMTVTYLGFEDLIVKIDDELNVTDRPKLNIDVLLTSKSTGKQPTSINSLLQCHDEESQWLPNMHVQKKSLPIIFKSIPMVPTYTVFEHVI